MLDLTKTLWGPTRLPSPLIFVNIVQLWQNTDVVIIQKTGSDIEQGPKSSKFQSFYLSHFTCSKLNLSQRALQQKFRKLANAFVRCLSQFVSYITDKYI